MPLYVRLFTLEFFFSFSFLLQGRERERGRKSFARCVCYGTLNRKPPRDGIRAPTFCLASLFSSLPRALKKKKKTCGSLRSYLHFNIGGSSNVFQKKYQYRLCCSSLPHCLQLLNFLFCNHSRLDIKVRQLHLFTPGRIS